MAAKRKAAATEESTDILPPDMVAVILSKLPVRSILQFRSVSRLWHSIISDPHFPKIQSLSTSSSRRRFFTSENNSGQFRFLNFTGRSFRAETLAGNPLSDDGSGDKISRSDAPIPKILSSCDGLHLLDTTDRKTIILFNPSTRVSAKIRWGGDSPAGWGLCRDAATGDYKVVIITKSRSYFVYSCRRMTWSQGKLFFRRFKFITDSGVFIGTAFYWIIDGVVVESQKSRRHLVWYDAAGDRWDNLRVPDQAQDHSFVAPAMLGDSSPGIICVKLRGHAFARLWRLEKNGESKTWKKLVTVVTRVDRCGVYKHTDCPMRPPVSLSENLVMIFVDCTRYVVYDVVLERMVGGVRKMPQKWGGKIVACLDRLDFPMNTRSVPWRKCRRNSRISLKGS
ncbi:F-box/kelch-repeat protein At3g06240-like [Andrographis paniculata]|uniref:F-box/kelch-repeat protein At3g06240-like n=1 Tax=Andrographis paniculata TaxID=175694 RepID=UPI0021E9565C|nr:F-box/kelch-repeat protein At3g06240-like [Andrographis paniculata]